MLKANFCFDTVVCFDTALSFVSTLPFVSTLSLLLSKQSIQHRMSFRGSLQMIHKQQHKKSIPTITPNHITLVDSFCADTSGTKHDIKTNESFIVYIISWAYYIR